MRGNFPRFSRVLKISRESFTESPMRGWGLLLCLLASLGANSHALGTAGRPPRAHTLPTRSLKMQSAPADDALQNNELLQVERDAKLDALAKKWEKRQRKEEIFNAQTLGWCPNAETINGRMAMFFLITGLVTEYYTGESIPQQVYTLFQTLGFVE